ncbi:MAG: rRNA maturation RNase YbeY [Verrucomicrobiales bacterium]|nr:rRNA maturation RNase YbeY [Verrucomicrobiales bacterium]
MIEVTVQKHPRTLPVRLRWLRRVAQAALGMEPIATRARAGGGISLVALDAARMAAVNETHLQHPGPTDVITFDYTGADAVGAGLRGEILVCPEVAAQQAREFRTSTASELVRYVAHGLLHLCGYDDHDVEDRRVMKRQENRLVRQLATQPGCEVSASGCPA